MKKYEIEREGQIDFFKNYGIPYEDDNSILVDNTDGVFNGNILEFKLNINNLNKVLFQAIKYLSRLRIKGESVPANILLIDLNNEKAYQYRTKDYIDDVQKVYIGAASKENQGFKGNNPVSTLYYSNMVDSNKLKKMLKDKKTIEEMYVPIDIDENCIVCWAERYYSELPTASKGDFLGDETGTNIKLKGEIRDPKHFKGLINAYTGKTNEKFKYLMDCLNDRLSKKDLGAFYTPMPYCKKATELVKIAVDKVPNGNDYIILDRCAGTGNLESALIGLYDKNGDELINHCVISTYEYYEYKVLNERLGDKVRDIIPPTEADVVYENGKVSNADAMSKDFINNPIIKEYVDNPNCTIILFENPPYSDSSAITFTEDNDIAKRAKTDKSGKFVVEEFKKKAIPKLNEQRGAVRESSNLFIWSAFEYYLRQPTDSCIVLSPVKYFKNVGLIHKKMEKGFAFNRQFFHATNSVISCILWSNTEDKTTSKWVLDVFDINENNEVVKCNECEKITIQMSKKGVSFFNDKRTFDNDVSSQIVCDSEGYPIVGWSHKTKTATYNDNIIAYMAVNGFTPDAKHRYLMRLGYKTGIEQSFGFYLRSDNFLNKLPLWVSKMLPQDKWYEKDIYNNTADGGEKYIEDRDFIKSCLIFTCLSNQNKCLSFIASDGKMYKNELCFDDNTLAKQSLEKYTLNVKEKELIDLWNKILNEAKSCENYNKSITYGIYQIEKELNTYTEKRIGKSKKRIYDYPVLNGDLTTLKTLLKDYYKEYITNKMFKYELVK